MPKFVPHAYQTHVLQQMIADTVFDQKPGKALFLDPGLGKTAITLAWIRIMKRMGLVQKTLIIAPLRVCYSVWPQEIRKWDQFNHMRISIVHGTQTQRMAALSEPADIYVINPEGVPFLADYYARRPVPFEALIIDESSKFKNWSAVRMKSLRKILPAFKYRNILTGTPSPHNLMDLFAQMFCIDLGETFGRYITKFRDRFFYRGGFQGHNYIPHETAHLHIERMIKPWCIRLSAEDHLDLPELLINDVWVDLNGEAKDQYKQMEKNLFLELAEGADLTPANAGARYNACKQIANGGLYDGEDKSKVYHLHMDKVDAVQDIVEELQGKPAVIAFQFKHDLQRLKKVWPKIPDISGGTSADKSNTLINKWNNGELPLLAVQPLALSHGINMQSGPGRDLIWLGLTDNLEAYIQLNARLYRQGVTGQVRVHRVLAKDTVDVAVRELLEAKDQSQRRLLDALNDYRKSRNV